MNWESIREEWESSEITLKELAAKHGVSESTMRSRKNREKWSRNATPKNATQRKDVATPKKQSSPKQTKSRRSGNPNPSYRFPKHNQAAVKHGFYSKHIPAETLELMQELSEANPADLLWEQIQIQYAAIIRAQRIMFVDDKNDLTKELKREKHQSGEKGSSWEEEYEIQFAWDKHAAFLNAQSRAMSELRSLLKQFCDIADNEDERLLRIEQMQLNIDKTRAEIDRIQEPEENDKPVEIIIRRKGESE